MGGSQPVDRVGDSYRVDLPTGRVPSGTLITARSYLIDRAVPACEVISLPARDIPAATVEFSRVDRLPPPQREPGVRGWLRRMRKPEAGRTVRLNGPLGVDFRVRSPANWSHFLNQHLPLAALMTRRMGVTPEDLTLILPADIPGYIHAAARLAGFSTQATDASVEGPGIVFSLPRNAFLAEARAWMEDAGLIERIARAQADGIEALPRRAFLARRKTRHLTNQPEIEAVLAPLGFETIYPEDLPVPDQFRVFNTAEIIVAVHGAGIAPLLYRHADSPLRQIVEIMPCGHMTDFVRGMASVVDCDWIGVRGRLKPEYVRPAYDLGRTFIRFSLDGFEADPVALQNALDRIGLSTAASPRPL